MRRPAELTGVAGSVALLIGRVFGIKDPDTLVSIGVVVGVLPAAATWIVTLIRHRNGDAPPPPPPA